MVYVRTEISEEKHTEDMLNLISCRGRRGGRGKKGTMQTLYQAHHK